MTKNRILTLVVALVALGVFGPHRAAQAQAEIRPLSVTKLRVTSAETAPAPRLEVGLLWEMGWYDKRFTAGGASEWLGREATRAEMGLRIIAGLLDKPDAGLELGALLPVVFEWSDSGDVSQRSSAVGLGDIPLGLKYRFFSSEALSIAAVQTVTVPTGDQVSGITDGYTSLAGGLVFSSQPLRWLSLDATLTAGGTFGIDDADKERVPAWGLSHEVGLALLMGRPPVLMPVFELIYRVNGRTEGEDKIGQKFLANVGLNLQLNDRVIIMQGAQVDLAGANALKGTMWFMSFLILT